MNNLEKIDSIRKFEKRSTELYEQKYNRKDWEDKKSEAITFYNKCKMIAYKEIF